MNSRVPKRIVLTEDGVGSLQRMIEALRAEGDSLRITPSKLVSWILRRYETILFIKDKGVIARDHFNSKRYLQQAIAGAKDADIPKILQETLSQLRTKTSDPKKSRGKVDGDKRPAINDSL